MGDAEGVFIGLDSIYREVIGTRSDVQGLGIQVTALRDDAHDHETRIRVVEANYVTMDELTARSGRTMLICGTVATVVAVLVSIIALLVQS